MSHNDISAIFAGFAGLIVYLLIEKRITLAVSLAVLLLFWFTFLLK